MKRMLCIGLLFSTAALAQQVDISGKDFLSGAGDARLQQIAREAAAKGASVMVTAPPYWQAKIAEKLHAGAANLKVHTSSGFFENVMVSVENGDGGAAKEAETAKAAASRASAAKAAAAKAAADRDAEQRAARAADAARIAAQREAAARAEAARQRAAREQAARDAAARAAAEKAAAEKAAAEKAAAEKAAAAKAEADRIAAIKHGMEKNLNAGHPAEGQMSVGDLQRDDQLFVDGSVRGVVRRSGPRTLLYWLNGDLNLQRIELMPVGEGSYKVLRPIAIGSSPVLRTRSGGRLNAKVPASGSAERGDLQRQYAEGHEISETLGPSELRAGDMLYTGESAAVVVRRSPSHLLRFWLVGDLDLGQVGLKKDHGNAYRVLSDTVK